MTLQIRKMFCRDAFVSTKLVPLLSVEMCRNNTFITCAVAVRVTKTDRLNVYKYGGMKREEVRRTLKRMRLILLVFQDDQSCFSKSSAHVASAYFSPFVVPLTRAQKHKPAVIFQMTLPCKHVVDTNVRIAYNRIRRIKPCRGTRTKLETLPSAGLNICSGWAPR